MMDSSKEGGHTLLKNKKKIFGAWIIVHSMYGNLEPFAFLTSLTFKYKHSWICGQMNELVSL